MKKRVLGVRTVVAVVLGGLVTVAFAANDDPAMLELAERSRCFQCHDVNDRVRGPAWREVAKRYRGNAEIYETLVKRVRDGSAGNWGDDSMAANKRVSEDDIRTLVRWILTLE